MHLDDKDAGYLWDMLDSAKTINNFLSGVSFSQYMQDRQLQLAVERSIEIIGEAARRISKVFQDAHSDIPWQNIMAQRNVLAHEYGEIKQELIWKVATVRIPELIAACMSSNDSYTPISDDFASPCYS
jgi:uncharacterized protein with HEPN domain